MVKRHTLCIAALGAFSLLAFGSSDSGGAGDGLGAQAVNEMEDIVCEGDNPFKLPIDSDADIWSAIKPHITSAKGMYVGEDYFLLMDEREIKGEWVGMGDVEDYAVEAIGQICSSSTECDGNTCIVKESLFDTQWHLEFRPDATNGWALVGYFTGTLDDDDTTRMAEVQTSMDAYNAAIAAELGDGAPEAPVAE